MKLYQLIRSTPWPDIKKAMLRIFKKDSYLESHMCVFAQLLEMSPSRSKGMRINISITKETGVDVYGKDGTLVKEMEDFKYFDKKYQHEHGNDEQSFAIEFRPWSQWLAMDIDPSCYENKRTNAEIVACCLYEMSFMGYTDAEVQTCGKRLLKRVNKAMKDIKSGKAKTYTMDEVKEKLHQRIKDENQKRLRK